MGTVSTPMNYSSPSVVAALSPIFLFIFSLSLAFLLFLVAPIFIA